MKTKSKESDMVICNMADKCDIRCLHKTPHKRKALCNITYCSKENDLKCIPYEHPQNTEEKKQQPDNPAEIVEKCMLLVNKIQSLAKIQHRVKTLENKVAVLEQQIRELKLCDCSLKQQPLKDANVYQKEMEVYKIPKQSTFKIIKPRKNITH